MQLLAILAKLAHLIDFHLLLPGCSNLDHALEALAVQALPIDLLHFGILALREITGALTKHKLIVHLLVLELGVKVSYLSVELGILICIV